MQGPGHNNFKEIRHVFAHGCLAYLKLIAVDVLYFMFPSSFEFNPFESGNVFWEVGNIC